MRIFRPGVIIRRLYPDSLFRTGSDEKVLCLTFDDGPDPVSTPLLLQLLSRRNIQAIFFCTGSTAERYPDLAGLIRSGGHVTGNHGYRHLDGWKTSTEDYIENVIRAVPFTSGRLFRPPYGRLTPGQYRRLKESFRIVFWDIMPFDFDRRFGSSNSLKILMRMIRPGSIIVLHDKPDSTLLLFLEEFIDRAAEAGYSFVLPSFFISD